MFLKEVWHHFLGRIEADTQQSILKILSKSGVKSKEFNPDSPGGAGMVFFSEINNSLQEFLRQASRQGLERVLAIAVCASVPSNTVVWSLLQSGASDVFSLHHSKDVGSKIAARIDRWRQIDEIVRSSLVANNLVGQSPAWIRALRQVIEVARFTDASILITGESGTGKEMVARLIHTLDEKRCKRNLVVLDCTTVVPELSGSEFFGHERGAFTTAISQREGAFSLADGGTLFLDEVGELPLSLQAELLRVVQEKTYKRVGSNQWQRTDFRLVCATNRNLLEQEERGEFRRDFYHRIASWTCHLPPLRERVEDVLPLARLFFQQICPDQEPLEIDDAVCEYLVKRAYPGNVRELRQLIARISCHHVGDGPITAGDIPEADRPSSSLDSIDWRDSYFERNIHRALISGANLKDITHAAEEAAERLALEEAEGNVARAAQKLGVNERTLQMHRAARRQNIAGVGGNGLK